MAIGFLLVRAAAVAALCWAAGLSPPDARSQAPGPHPPTAGTEHEPPESDFDFLHLDLQLRLELEQGRAHGMARYAATAVRDNLSRIVLFSADTDVNSVALVVDADSAVALSFEKGSQDSLIIFLADTLRGGEQVTFLIDYVTEPSRGMYFFRPTRAAPARKAQVWTRSAPEQTRYWLPVFDAPGAKMTSDFHISVSEPLLALSNGELVSETAGEEGWSTFHYRQSMPHPPHRFAVVAGEYELVRDMLTLPGARQVPIRYWVYPERIGDVYRTLGRTPEIIAFFSRLLDYPYPWETYSQAVVQDLPTAGAGNTGAVIFPERLLIDERAALDFDPDRAVAHQIATQWFGSLVTAAYWDHLWLDAGFSSYFEAVYTGHAGGEDAYQLRMLEFRRRYLDEAARYRRALVWNRWHDPVDVFDAHSYYKGAWVMHMLRHQMGGDAFERMIRRYVGTHAFENVQTHHLEKAVVDATATDYSRFFDQWVYAAGHPELEISYSHEFSEGVLRVRVRQVQSGDLVPEVFRFNTAIEVSSLGDVARFDLEVRDRDHVFTFPVSMRPDFVLFDPDHVLLAETRIEQPAISWMRQLRNASSIAGRLEAASRLAAFSDDPALLLGLREALAAEESPDVRAAIVLTMGTIPASPMVERSLHASLEDEQPAVRKAALRGLGAYERSPEVTAAALQRAEEDESYEVVAEAVRTLAAVRSPQAFDVVRSALVTPSHREVVRAAAFDAMAALGTPPARAYPLANEWTREDRPVDARVAATRYLGVLAAGHQPSMRRLAELASDRNVRVRMAVVEALQRAGTAGAKNQLERMAERDPDGRVRAAVRHALAAAE